MTIEKLNKIPPAFCKDGLITVASASVKFSKASVFFQGISDGATAQIVAGQDAINELGLTPLVRITGWKIVGCDPNFMGIGPVNAILGLLKEHKLLLDDISLIEV